MTDTAVPETGEARRLAAVRGFQAARGRYPDMMAAHRAEKLAEMEADDRAEEAADRARAAQEPAAVEL